MHLSIDSVEYMDPCAPVDLIGPRFGNPEEHRKVRRLIRFMATRGFRVHSLAIEGEGYVRVSNERETLCEIFEWDAYITLRFIRNSGEKLFGVLLVQGNGEDIISDYTWDGGDDIGSATPGSFAEAMTAFEKSEEEREV